MIFPPLTYCKLDQTLGSHCVHGVNIFLWSKCLVHRLSGIAGEAPHHSGGPLLSYLSPDQALRVNSQVFCLPNYTQLMKISWWVCSLTILSSAHPPTLLTHLLQLPYTYSRFLLLLLKQGRVKGIKDFTKWAHLVWCLPIVHAKYIYSHEVPAKGILLAGICSPNSSGCSMPLTSSVSERLFSNITLSVHCFLLSSPVSFHLG